MSDDVQLSQKAIDAARELLGSPEQIESEIGNLNHKEFAALLTKCVAQVLDAYLTPEDSATERLRKESVWWRTAFVRARLNLIKLTVENTRLRKALEFYADPAKWADFGYGSGVCWLSQNPPRMDKGQTARTALNAEKGRES